MPKPSAADASQGNSTAEMPFEEALEKLESIVESMEDEDLPLETLLARFEDGSKLAKACQARLADAELKIKKLEQTASGELETSEFDPDDDND